MRSRSKFNLGQTNRLSEVLGNIAVAWFSVGVIAPLFTRPDLVDFIIGLVVSSFVTGVFLGWSLYLIREGKK